MDSVLYLDASAILRATLEAGLSPEVDGRIEAASSLVTSRLSTVECSRAIHRVRILKALSEERLAEVEREIADIFGRCEIWELDLPTCELARVVVPDRVLRSLDALHLATYLCAKKRVADLELLSTDDRLRAAAGAAGP